VKRFPVSHSKRKIRIPVRGAVREEAPATPLKQRDRVPKKPGRNGR